jgi:regulator of RNase E activity RraA
VGIDVCEETDVMIRDLRGDLECCCCGGEAAR